MIACRLLTKDASSEQKRQLATVLASDAGSEGVGGCARYLEDEFADLDVQRRFYVVVELDRAIVGFVRVWHSPHIGEWVNDGIVVLPGYRRRGLGTRLLHAALDLAARRGAESIVAHIRDSNPASIALHERVGFRREVSCYRNSYGELRPTGGWQYRLCLSGRYRTD